MARISAIGLLSVSEVLSDSASYDMAMTAIAAGFIALALGASEALVDPVANCNQEDDRQRQITGCSEVISRDGPRDSMPFINRGIAFASTRQFDRAISDFNAALKINPYEVLAYYNRGNVYYDLGQYGRAISDYAAAIEIEPENALIYFNRALAYERLGKQKNAVSDLRAAIAIDPEFASARARLSRLLKDRRRPRF